MIDPTEEDIGRRVLHRPRPGSKPEVGFVVGLVRRSKIPAARIVTDLSSDDAGRVAYCENLEWDGERQAEIIEGLTAEEGEE